MPNWCDNYLKIEGSETDLQKFKDENWEGECLSFVKSCPIPEEFDNNDGWYDWCCWDRDWETLALPIFIFKLL